MDTKTHGENDRVQREDDPASTFVLDFWLPELRENSFLLF